MGDAEGSAATRGSGPGSLKGVAATGRERRVEISKRKREECLEARQRSGKNTKCDDCENQLGCRETKKVSREGRRRKGHVCCCAQEGTRSRGEGGRPREHDEGTGHAAE